MATKEEISKVVEWCRKKLAEKGRPCIERNPFTREIKWMERFPLVYIDIRKESVPKECLHFDSENGNLSQFIGKEWCAIFPDLAGKKQI